MKNNKDRIKKIKILVFSFFLNNINLKENIRKKNKVN